MQLRRLATSSGTGPGAILYDPSRIDHPTAADFERPHAALAATPGGRGAAYFVAARAPEGGRWVLRHYRRGGFVARWIDDRYAWLGEEGTRCFRELRLLAELERLGLPAARPVAARYVRTRLGYTADLLTVAIEGARPLASLLGPDLPLAACRRIGECVRRFHDAGVFHADLNAHNVLLDAAERVHLVDFDRGALRRPGAWRHGNLARLERSLAKVARERPGAWRAEQWAALLEGYGPPRGRLPR